jgi:outer membrane lipoprotein-sorting protein
MTCRTPGWWRMVRLLACLAVLGAAVALVAQAAARAGENSDPYKLLVSTSSSFASVQGYTAKFTKQERVNGDLRPRETIFMKFQKPFKVYMKWLDGAKEGQEILYVKGKNGNKILAHPGFGGTIGGMINMILPTFAISPDGPSAMQDNRHPITGAGIGKLIEKIIQVSSKALENDELSLTYKGEVEVDGRPAVLVERILPQKDGYPAHRTHYYLDKEYNLPVKVVLHDWSGRLTASYEYTALVLNPALEPIDFEIRNKEYRFGLLPTIIKD